MIVLRLLAESFNFATASLLANKLRTFLSLLGITIGIFAIISVFTMVDAIRNNIDESISSLGDNVVYVQKWPWEFGSEYPWWKYMSRPVTRLQELDEISERSKLAEASACKSAVFLTNTKKSNRSNCSKGATLQSRNSKQADRWW